MYVLYSTYIHNTYTYRYLYIDSSLLSLVFLHFIVRFYSYFLKHSHIGCHLYLQRKVFHVTVFLSMSSTFSSFLTIVWYYLQFKEEESRRIWCYVYTPYVYGVGILGGHKENYSIIQCRILTVRLH